jgi:hypothetical protein
MLKLPAQFSICEYHPAQPGAIEASVCIENRFSKAGNDFFQRWSAGFYQCTGNQVGVDHADTQIGEISADGALAAADATG